MGAIEEYDLDALLPLYLGMMLVTFIPRYLPMAVLTRFRLPAWAERWLGLVPTAVMAALTVQSLHPGGLSTAPEPENLLAALPAALVAWRTRNLFYTVLAGLGAKVALRRFTGL